MKPKRISLAEAVELVLSQEGKIMTVEFVKRTTGEIRIMNCRCGVRKYVTGEGAKYSFKDRELIPVYDLQKRAYRTINARAIRKVTAGGSEYVIG